MNITTLLAACTMASCVTLVVAGDGRTGSDPDRPLTKNGSNTGSGSSGGAGGDERTHGLDGERWQDRVPREPMYFINAGPGETNHHIHPEDNARGYAVWWRGDRAVDELIKRIHIGYNMGARWFFINRPMGSTQARTNLPGASWLTLKGQKRSELPERITRAVLDDFDEPVHIVWYVGSDMSDPREYPGYTDDTRDQFYKLGETSTWEQLIGSRVTLGGWLSTGASGLGLDHTALPDEREHFINLFEQLNAPPFKMNLYGEALPVEFQNNRGVRDQYNGLKLDQDAIKRMPWMATTAYYDHRWPLGAATEVYPVNSDDTRLFVWFEKSSQRYGTEDERIELVNEYMDRGLIPITYDPVMFQEALRRNRPSYSTSRSGGSSGSTGGSSGSGDSGTSGSSSTGGSQGTGVATSSGSNQGSGNRTTTVRKGNSNQGQTGGSTSSKPRRVTRKSTPSNRLPKRYQRRTANADSD